MIWLRSALRLGIAALLVSSGAGCASSALETRVELLDRELADQRTATKRLENRLDELQIQLSLLSRARPGDSSEQGAEPKLQVLKLQPPPPLLKLDESGRSANRPPADEHARRTARRRHDWQLHEVKVKPVDPAEVTERLPVDQAAADRPLLGSGVEPADSPAADSAAADAGSEDQAAAEHRAEDARATAAFHAAFELYRTNAFGESSLALVEFARRHPDHELAPEALYYAGKARMMIEQYPEAEKQFLELARRYPKGKHAAEALLLGARCQEHQHRTEDARSTYLQLVDAYPLSREAGQANERLQSIR